VRGSGLYFERTCWQGPDFEFPGPPPAGDKLAATPVTLTGWVKVRFAPVPILRVSDTREGLNGHLYADGSHVRGMIRDPWLKSVTGRVDSFWTVSGPWSRDDGWHHAAVVCEPADKTAVVTLYVDGEARSTASLERPVIWKEVQWLRVGPAGVNGGDRSGLATLTDPDGKPHPLDPNELVSAVDEVCVFTRALAPHEIRYLAGREKDAQPKPPDEAPAPPRPKPSGTPPDR
jgi:hypothetical protein